MAVQRRRHLSLVAFCMILTACGNPVGTPCQITGSGFTASDDCRSKCLSRWAVRCPNGESMLPNVCAGHQDCEPGSCPDGQLCYYFDDPFEKRSYCVPDTVCGAALTGSAASDWEADAKARADASRAASEERSRLRREAIENGQPETSAPAMDNGPQQ